MNIYLITQTTETGYDTYDAVVVAAETPEQAKEINPASHSAECWWEVEDWISFCSWAHHPDQVQAKLIGTTDHAPGVILSSFNAG